MGIRCHYYKINSKLIFSLLFLFTLQISFSQEVLKEKKDPNSFDEKAAYAQAKAKGISKTDIEGYVQFLKRDFYCKKDHEKHGHVHSPYDNHASNTQKNIIYLNGNKPATVGCDNMGFELYNFNNWTGTTGQVSNGAPAPVAVYTPTGTAIISPAGNNVFMNNTLNYQTLMSIPPTNNIYPNCNQGGYDSIACRVIGAQTISEVPFVSPFSFDGVSARLNGTNANYRAAELKYVVTTSSSVKRLSFSYALVLQNGGAGHSLQGGPIFKVEVKNENTGLNLPGCTSYTFDPYSGDTSLVQSSVDFQAVYRKWKNYSVDLSTLPNNTPVSVTFLVTGCDQSGHWGYAYVDAECGGIGNTYANMCSGSTFATLIAPTGFVSYQWLDPSNNPIVGATNDTLIVNPANVGDIYSVNLMSPGGCTLTQTVSVALTTVNIINLNSTSSCAGGNSGTAFVQANGSNGTYSYTWTATSGPNIGTIVSYSQTATGLAPGTYSVLVASTLCGQASANISVGVAPPYYFSQSRSFCGTSTFIPRSGGTNYQWYAGSGSTATVIAAPNGINDTLMINNAVSGDVYTLVYENASGCTDSLKYTLNPIPGGNTYISNVKNVCPGNSDGSAVINLSTTAPPNYNYIVYGPGSTVITNTTTPAYSVTVSPLAIGVYTAVVTDGVCIYGGNTFIISNIQTTFTASATNTVLCFPTDTAKVYLDFGASIPSVCGLSSTGACTNPSIIQVGTGTNVNTTTSYPAVYGNFYKNTRHQILYRASELLAAGVQPGKISSIAFNITAINGTSTYPDFTIKMKCTSLTALSGNTFDNTALVQVYYAPSVTINTGLNTYVLPVAYEWDGTSSILIDVCNSLTTAYTNNSSSPYTTTPFVSVRYMNSDVTPACMTTNNANNTSSNRPNIQFGNCASTSAVAYTVSVSSNGTITQNYANDSLKIVPTFTAAPTPQANTVYTITVINPDGGCTATRTVAVLYPTSQVSITTAISTPTICEGDQVSLSANGALNYNWYYQQGGSQVPIATTASINVTPPSIGTNSYIVTGSAPCPNVLPDTKTVTVNVIPKANLTIASLLDITKCMNRDYVITTGVGSTTPGNDGTPPYSYSWTTLPGGAPAPGNNTLSSYTANSNTTSTFVVTVNGVCANPISDTVVVTNFINDLSITITDSSSTCANTPFTLNSSVTGGYPNYNYSWYLVPSGVISTDPSLSYNSPANEGNYNIVVSVTDSCGYNASDSQIINVLPPCSVIIPNVITPNGDGINEFFIVANIEHHPNTSLTIFDRWGRKVYENQNYNNEWKADGAADGTYFYVIDVPEDKKHTGFITVFHGK